MKLTLTEVCDVTGSWLKDFDLDFEAPLAKSKDLYSLVGKKIRFNELKRFNSPNFDADKINTKWVLIRQKSRTEQYVSYKLHTNRELAMMLENRKDFSVFYRDQSEEYDIYNGQEFFKYKKEILSRRHCSQGIEYVFKYKPNSEWKIEAFKLLVEIRRYAGNSTSLEFYEGELLGYSREQNLEYRAFLIESGVMN